MNSSSLAAAAAPHSPSVWRPSPALVALIVVSLAISPIAFFQGLDLVWGWAVNRPEYSHILLMPLIAAFIIWQQRARIEQSNFRGSWAGVALTVAGALLLLLGKAGTLLTIQQYAYVLTLGGLALALMGRDNARGLLVPFAILVLAVPLPEFLYQRLSAELQLLSSQLGVAFIRLCGISVFLEGNRIDLGSYQLEVAEACSGLRYLFPLMTLGFIMAYFYKTSFWKRAVLFLSAIPVTIVMNSLRIGLIGVTVDRWGPAAAQGFLHDFEGWAMFMVSAAVLFGEIVLLSVVGRDRRPWRTIFGLEFPARVPAEVPRRRWQPNAQFVSACVVLALLSVGTLLWQPPAPVVPARRGFAEFPLQLGAWSGTRQAMLKAYLDQLQLTDYIMADYVRPGSNAVDFYVSWYDTQSAGRSVHSPSACLPGGGWRVDSLRRQEIADINIAGHPLAVNRALIQLGDERQLVWYWFEQRGRIITNEYLVKWYLFWDSVTRNRSDGAMVRVMAPVSGANGEATAEAQMHELVSEAARILPDYVPG